MKKLVALLLVVMLVAAMAFTGCQKTEPVTELQPSNETNEPSEPQETEIADPKPESIEIDYAYTGAMSAEEYMPRFEKQFKDEYGIDVKVNLLTSAFEDIDVVKTAVAAGTGPDVWHMDVNYFSSFKDTVIQPISSYLDPAIWDEYQENGVGVWKDGSDYYALPVSFSVVSMIYNVDAVAEAGVEMGQTWTFEEFEAALETCFEYYEGKTITYTDGNEYPYFMLPTQHTMYYWWLFYGVYGAEPMYTTNNIAQEAFVNAITKMAEWRAKGYLKFGSEVGPTSNRNAAFANAGNILFLPTGDWSVSGFTQQELGINTEALPLNTNYASIPSPMGPDGKPHTEIYNQGVVLNKNTEGWEAKAAAELIKFMVYDDDNWYELYGPGCHNYCMPGKKAWAEKYQSEWITNEDHAAGFLYTIANGVCNSPDYDNDGIDVTTMTTGVILDAFTFVDEAGTFNEADVRALVTSKLEEQQVLYNQQLEENDRELDNPDAKVK